MIPVAEACEECTLNCQLVHGKRNPSSVITTFFKVMIGDTYSEVMFLPPRFALTIQNLVRKEIQLEDSSGQKWPARLNRVDGRLAFQEGWNKFFMEHNLKFGDFLVFHYIRGSHFVVSMYGESGCPENRHFGVNRHQKKKMRKKGNSLADDNRPSNMNANGCRHSIASSSRSGPFVSDHETIHRDADNSKPSNMKTNGLRHSMVSSSQSGTIVSVTKTSQRSEPFVTNTSLDFDNDNGKVDIAAETPKSIDPLSVVVAGTPNPCVLDPFCMFDRDKNNVEEESRRSLLGDLSAFENHMNQFNAGGKIDVAGGGYKSFGYEQGEFRRSLLDLSFEIQNNMTKNVNEECIQEPAENCNSSGVMPMEATGQNADTIPPTKKAKSTQTELGRTDKDKWVEAFHATSYTTKVAKKKAAVTGDVDCPDSIMEGNSIKVTKKEQLTLNHDLDPKQNILHDYKPKDIKAGSRSSGSLGEDLDQNTQCVKEEPVDLDDTPLPHSGGVLSFAVMKDTDYLELPPTFESRISRRGRPVAKVILLRVETDPNLFPVLYEYKYGFKILSSCWRDFVRANRFNPGDTFEFRLENVAESIFRVCVVPK